MNFIRRTLKNVIYGGASPNPQYLANSIFRGISQSPDLHQIVASLPPDDASAAKIQVATYLATLCLFMREVSNYYPRYASQEFFIAMLDETKRLISLSGIRLTSPIEMFPNDEQRQTIVGLLVGPEHVNSVNRIIAPDKLFSMLFSFYAKHLSAGLEQLKVGKLSPMTLPNETTAITMFISTVTFGNWEDLPPERIDRFAGLGAFMIGLVNAAINSSPIR